MSTITQRPVQSVRRNLVAVLLVVASLLVGALATSPAAGADEGEGLALTAEIDHYGVSLEWTDPTPGRDPQYRVRAEPGDLIPQYTSGVVRDSQYRGDAHFPTGKIPGEQTYRFVVEQLAAGAVVESARVSLYLPAHVQHPTDIALVGERSDRGGLIPGETYRVVTSGAWEEGAVFSTNISVRASDYIIGVASSFEAAEPITEFTLPENRDGMVLNYEVVATRENRLPWSLGLSNLPIFPHLDPVTSLDLAQRKVTSRQRAWVRVSVNAPLASSLRGTIYIYDYRTRSVVGEADIRTDSGNSRTTRSIRIDRLRPGAHRLQAVYIDDSGEVERSISPRARLQVTRQRRR